MTFFNEMFNHDDQRRIVSLQVRRQKGKEPVFLQVSKKVLEAPHSVSEIKIRVPDRVDARLLAGRSAASKIHLWYPGTGFYQV